MSHKLYFFIALLAAPLMHGAASSSTAADTSADAPTTFKGQYITAENLHLLGEPLPNEVATELQRLHPALTALCKNVPQQSDWTTIRNTPEFQENKSRHNKAFELLLYMLKISGFSNRLQSMLITKGVWPGQWGSAGAVGIVVVHGTQAVPLAQVLPEFIPTYQTASRLRNYLLCTEVIRQKGLQAVQVPQTFLHLLDPTQPPHDENSVIIEKKINAPRLERKNLNDNLTDMHVKELFALIEEVGLWTLVKGNYELTKPEASAWHIDDILRDDAGVLYLIDLEQPNNSSPEHFFERNNVEHHGNIKSGIEQLAVLCAHDPKKVALLTELVHASEKINSIRFSQRFKNEIDAVLTQVSAAIEAQP